MATVHITLTDDKEGLVRAEIQEDLPLQHLKQMTNAQLLATWFLKRLADHRPATIAQRLGLQVVSTPLPKLYLPED